MNYDEGYFKLQDINNKMVSLTEKAEAVVRAVNASNTNNKSKALDIADNDKPFDRWVTEKQKLITCFRCDRAGHLARECRVDIWCANSNLRGHLARNCRKKQVNNIANVTTG